MSKSLFESFRKLDKDPVVAKNLILNYVDWAKEPGETRANLYPQFVATVKQLEREGYDLSELSDFINQARGALNSMKESVEFKSKSGAGFMSTLREGLTRSEAELSAEAGLKGLNRIQSALTIAGLKNVQCIDWRGVKRVDSNEQAIFDGNAEGQDLRFICIDTGEKLKVIAQLDVEDDGDFVTIMEDSVKWTEDLADFFGTLIYKTVRAR